MSAFKLNITNLSVAYDKRQILHNISFNISSEQIIGILGNSGSGKTTLLNTLTCTLPSSATVNGSLYWNGLQLLHNPQHEKMRGKKITMLPQQTNTSLFPLLKIKEQLYLTLQAKSHTAKKQAEQKALEILTLLHFDNPQAVLDSYPFQLSGGMQQRVCLALCLLLEPALLLADEPTSGLDVIAQNELLQLLHNYCQSSNTAMLITSHNPGFLCRIADSVIVMQNGHIIETGEPEQIFQHPRTDYTRQLFAASPHNCI